MWRLHKLSGQTASMFKHPLSEKEKKLVFIWCSHESFLFFKSLGPAEKSLASLVSPKSWLPWVLLPSPCYFPKSCLRSLRRCLLICASLLLGFAPFPTSWDRPCLSLEEVTSESSSDLLHPSFQGCIPGDSSRPITEVSEACFTQAQGCVLLFVLLSPLRILNCTHSSSVQPSLPPTFTTTASSALFASTKSSRQHFLVVSLIICTWKLSWTHSRNLFGPYRVVLPKNAVVNVPQEPGPVNEILLPVVWRQSKLYFQS